MWCFTLASTNLFVKGDRPSVSLNEEGGMRSGIYLGLLKAHAQLGFSASPIMLASNLFQTTMKKSPNRPDTPCVAVCSTTFDEVCRGCGRTVAEVAHWVFMTEEEKDRVWQRITAEGYPRRQS